MYENAQWKVASFGMVSKDYQGENGGYLIEAERLLKPNERWIDHIADKPSFDVSLFIDAFYKACELVGGKKYERDVMAIVPDHRAEYVRERWEIEHEYRPEAKSKFLHEMAAEMLEKLRSDASPRRLYTVVKVSAEHAGWLERVSPPVTPPKPEPTEAELRDKALMDDLARALTEDFDESK